MALVILLLFASGHLAEWRPLQPLPYIMVDRGETNRNLPYIMVDRGEIRWNACVIMTFIVYVLVFALACFVEITGNFGDPDSQL